MSAQGGDGLYESGSQPNMSGGNVFGGSPLQDVASWMKSDGGENQSRVKALNGAVIIVSVLVLIVVSWSEDPTYQFWNKVAAVSMAGALVSDGVMWAGKDSGYGWQAGLGCTTAGVVAGLISGGVTTWV